jgi:hypothetical protein
MGFGAAFLSLCLAVSVHADFLIPLGDGAVKTLAGTTVDGAALAMSSMNLHTTTFFPTSDWSVAAWVQIKPATADSARFFQFKGFNGEVPVECYVT